MATRIKLLVEENGWSQGKTAVYFNKDRTWINHYINIANNLSTTPVTAVTPLSYRSARELAKLPPNKQEQAFRLARKMARHDRKLYPSSKVMAKVITPPGPFGVSDGEQILI